MALKLLCWCAGVLRRQQRLHVNSVESRGKMSIECVDSVDSVDHLLLIVECCAGLPHAWSFQVHISSRFREWVGSSRSLAHQRFFLILLISFGQSYNI